MKVSVIIPNYNHEKFLQQRIQSVLDQDYENFELILMDDCSSDNSKDIIKSFETHPKVSHVLLNDVNSGSTFMQWDKGINETSGEWIWIAESDDWCEKNFLSTLVEGISNNPAAVLAFSQSYLINNDKEVRGISRHRYLYETVNGSGYLKNTLLKVNTVYNASMAIFKKSAYKKITTYYRNFKFIGDWLFWIEIAQQGDVFISGKILNYFRKHAGDVSGKSYENGTFYSEKLTMLLHLTKYGLLTEAEKQMAVLDLYNRLMHDKKLDKKLEGSIKKQIAKASNQSNFTLHKSWLQKFWKRNVVIKTKDIYSKMINNRF